ncbi:antibiotic biosynthesis monooxygenase [Aliishimia ponticola]|uniref:Antibiotic biosynthesis monooxygenase n=1 Tax=Aliishimia ponticola TaxID=2499833 RepID=A0A4S4NCV2_9RHOB|nr:putative quinol monooxygenase [Aliishimia ponticola]THH37286.1 antibiotic biosynthesis monooxygenase [Aliishimia ponticola]
MSVIHVIAVITAQPGQRANLLELFNKNAATVRTEKGCIAYEATIDTENAGPMQTEFGPDTFVVVEQWESMQALGAHAVAPHMKEYSAQSKAMVAGSKIHILSPA